MNSSNSLVPSIKALNASVIFWFCVAVIGQWIFAYYVSDFYVGSAIEGDFEKWNDVLPHGYSTGDTMNNWSMAIHLFLSIIIMVGGPLQLVPQIRNRYKKFHKWNGRIFLITSVIVSLTGFMMILLKGSVSGLIGDISISINAFLIWIFAYLTISTAMSKKFESHRRWAIRLFLVVNGVWFFRVGLMFWIILNGGPVGFDPETFRGPFLVFLGFAQYVLPLLVFEIYLRAQSSEDTRFRWMTSILIIVLTLIMAVGIMAATMGMWFPRI